MNDAEGLNFKVELPKDLDKRTTRIEKPRSYKANNPDLNDIFNFIQKLPVSDQDKDRLLGFAKKVPHGALANFRKNYMNYLTRSKKWQLMKLKN